MPFRTGILDSCSFDYLTRDDNLRSYGISIFVFDFCVPLFTIVFSYISIVKAIFAHEAAMREQAKKMNVSNLRSNQVNLPPLHVFQGQPTSYLYFTGAKEMKYQ